MKGPFYKNKNDIFKTDTGVRIFINIFLFLFVIGFVVYVGVFINNFPFENTYFKNPGMPGTLFSERYNLSWFLMMMSVIAQAFMIFCITTMIIYRNNFCNNVFSFLFYGLFYLLLVFVVIMLALDYANCNNPDQSMNICNDRLWCCVYYTNPINMCSNTLACVPPVTASDLKPLFDFEAIFFTNVVIAGLHLIFIVVVLVYWFSDSQEEEEEIKKIPDNNVGVVEKKIDNTFKSTNKNSQRHGLRKRK